MITVSHDFTCPVGQQKQAMAVVSEYRQLFDPSPSCRVFVNASGNVNRFFIEDDFDSLADYEVKWAERTATPEFQAWIEKWVEVTIDGSFEVNFRRIVE